jgi:hypothetical protein
LTASRSRLALKLELSPFDIYSLIFHLIRTVVQQSASMLVALLVVVPATTLFLAWFYLFRNNTDIPVSPGSKPIVGHMHLFMDITPDTLYL